MKLSEENVEATDEMVTAVCELLQDVVEQLIIKGWQINEEGKERMRNALDLPTSKVSVTLSKIATSLKNSGLP